MKINKYLILAFIFFAITNLTAEEELPRPFCVNTFRPPENPASGKVEISFNYVKQSGFSSNQFAVWIEDSSGRYIKTIYVTRFTAKGGWEYRPNAIPVWVKTAHVSGMSEKQVDAVTGPTPSGGGLVYVWDCKDCSGNPIAAGEYRYIVEATLRKEYRVMFTGIIKIGGQAQESRAKAEYTAGDKSEREMITGVAAKYSPL